MEQHIIYAAAAAAFLLSSLTVFYCLLSEKIEEIRRETNLNFNSIESNHISLEARVRMEAFDKKLDALKESTCPQPNEEPNHYLKRMGWDLDYIIHRKRAPYTHWKTKQKEERMKVKDGSHKEKATRSGHGSKKTT
jgi:hypothetical protein